MVRKSQARWLPRLQASLPGTEPCAWDFAATDASQELGGSGHCSPSHWGRHSLHSPCYPAGHNCIFLSQLDVYWMSMVEALAMESNRDPLWSPHHLLGMATGTALGEVATPVSTAAGNLSPQVLLQLYQHLQTIILKI